MFTDYVAPRVLGSRFDDVIKQFRDEHVIEPALLDEAAGAVLASRGTNVSGRPIWVD